MSLFSKFGTYASQIGGIPWSPATYSETFAPINATYAFSSWTMQNPGGAIIDSLGNLVFVSVEYSGTSYNSVLVRVTPTGDLSRAKVGSPIPNTWTVSLAISGTDLYVHVFQLVGVQKLYKVSTASAFGDDVLSNESSYVDLSSNLSDLSGVQTYGGSSTWYKFTNIYVSGDNIGLITKYCDTTPNIYFDLQYSTDGGDTFNTTQLYTSSTTVTYTALNIAFDGTSWYVGFKAVNNLIVKKVTSGSVSDIGTFTSNSSASYSSNGFALYYSNYLSKCVAVFWDNTVTDLEVRTFTSSADISSYTLSNFDNGSTGRSLYMIKEKDESIYVNWMDGSSYCVWTRFTFSTLSFSGVNTTSLTGNVEGTDYHVKVDGMEIPGYVGSYFGLARDVSNTTTFYVEGQTSST